MARALQRSDWLLPNHVTSAEHPDWSDPLTGILASLAALLRSNIVTPLHDTQPTWRTAPIHRLSN